MEEAFIDERYKALMVELSKLLNKYSQEGYSDTPDYMLAGFMLGCLNVYENTVTRRENFFGRKLSRDINNEISHPELSSPFKSDNE